MDPMKAEELSPIRAKFEDLLQRREFTALEEAWLEEIARAGEGPPEDPKAFLEAADVLIAQGEWVRARTLLELFLPVYGGKVPARRLEVLRRMVFASPGKDDLRSDFIECFREAYPGDRFAEACLMVSGIETAADSASALGRLESLLRFKPGTCVYHEEGWGVGVVESVDSALRQAVVDLEKKRRHRIALQAIPEILKPLPEDHFFALGREGGERLKALADSDPVRLVEILLVSFGSPQELKAMKGRLVPEILSSEGWSRWWGRAKDLLRTSGRFRVSDRSPFLVERLEKSVSYEDELIREFGASDWQGRLAISRKHGRDRSGKFPALRERILATLREAVSREKGARALEAALVLERIAPDQPGKEDLVPGALRASGDPVEAVLGIENAEDRRRALEAIPNVLGEGWPEVILALFAKGDDLIRDLAAHLLQGSTAESKALQLVAESVKLPRSFPDLYTWACRTVTSGGDSPLLEPLRGLPPSEILRRIFDLLDSLGMRAERDGKAALRDLLGGARDLLAAEGNRFFRETTRPMERAEARAFYQRVLSSGGLSEPLRMKLLEILMTEFPDLHRPEARPIWEEDTIYVTEVGLGRKKAEFKDLTEEKLPKNFQDIGRAAAFGDLSENAEYTYALEERDRLTKKATELKAQLDRVRLIGPAMVVEGVIGLGSRIRLANPQTGHEMTYKILGPWDGQPEDGVLSYRSPLAVSLLGKKVGDEVDAQLPGGIERFRVMEIGSIFEPRPPASPDAPAR